MTELEHAGELPIWHVYRSQPGYIARKWVVEGSVLTATVEVMEARRLADLRDALAGMGLTRLDRMPEDDPRIVEVWL